MTVVDARALARRTDPETSKTAAAHAARRRLRVRDRVAYLLEQHGPLADHELAELYENVRREHGWPEAAASSLRSRRNELYIDGEAEVVPDLVRRTPAGYVARVWRTRVSRK